MKYTVTVQGITDPHETVYHGQSEAEVFMWCQGVGQGGYSVLRIEEER